MLSETLLSPNTVCVFRYTQSVYTQNSKTLMCICVFTCTSFNDHRYRVFGSRCGRCQRPDSCRVVRLSHGFNQYVCARRRERLASRCGASSSGIWYGPLCHTNTAIHTQVPVVFVVRHLGEQNYTGGSHWISTVLGVLICWIWHALSMWCLYIRYSCHQIWIWRTCRWPLFGRVSLEFMDSIKLWLRSIRWCCEL